ncbi:MAG: OmpH family outer membrane protein [Candidatus Omnitrophica bacterium]|nr:OmpH family outer membrane protein [Candidatus Omnitrophota bacterium]MDD5310878.1 OmpH family outer membrane protein [Candidatus Omnitrophota bacterium]MDD5546374.1 OmpH family outer membrane protein [Candidatus Omnitrophota bacterium]
MKAMSKLVILAFLFSLSMASVNMALAAGDKIGYMDLGKVFDEYNKTKDLDKQLESKSSGKQGERDKLVAEIKKMKDDLDLAKESDKAKKTSAVQEKLNKLQDFDKESRDTLRKDRDDMARVILKEIKDTIDNIGKKEGYKYIFDSRAVLFGSDTDNLTSRILKILNDQYAAKGKR